MTTGADGPSRRIVFQGLSALGIAAVLAGCGGDEQAAPTTSTSEEPTGPSGPGKSPSNKTKETKGSKKPTKVEALATTDEIPVGGGLVLTAAKIVITQPSQGEFKAFSAVCTHQGQTVGEVDDNTITCTFHGSQYDAATGAVTNGPAPAALDPVKVRVKGGQIVRA